jgi:hypothetical protein
MGEELDNNIDINDNKPITKIEVSPNEKYLVIYDDCSIFGWSVEDENENPLKFDEAFKPNVDHEINQLCVSNDKKLACVDSRHSLSKL